MSNINQLLVQAQTAYDAADWSSVIQYLQQLILGADSEHPEIVKNQEHLLTLTLSMLEMGDFQQRWEITKVLTHLGKIAIPPLIDILKDEDAEEELRWYAARTLGEFQHPEAIAPLVELLKTDEDEELKAIAATALGQMICILNIYWTWKIMRYDTDWSRQINKEVPRESKIIYAIKGNEEQELFLHQNKRRSALYCAASLLIFTCP